jgi:hypothetical protein
MTCSISKAGSVLKIVIKKIHEAHNRVRHTMNQFVIATGSYVVPLGNKAKEAAKKSAWLP